MNTGRDAQASLDTPSAEGREEIKNVTIGFRPYDLDNIRVIRALTRSSTNAQAVSIALSLARFIIEAIARGEHLLFRNRDKELERIRIPYLEHLERST